MNIKTCDISLNLVKYIYARKTNETRCLGWGLQSEEIKTSSLVKQGQGRGDRPVFFMIDMATITGIVFACVVFAHWKDSLLMKMCGFSIGIGGSYYFLFVLNDYSLMRLLTILFAWLCAFALGKTFKFVR